MEWLVLGHVLGDFYLQSDGMVEKKKEYMWHLVLHGIIYILPIGLFISMYNNHWILAAGAVIFILVMHLIVDKIKILLDKYLDGKSKKDKCLVFLIDQLVHVLCIVLAIYLFEINTVSRYEWINTMDIVVVIAVLVCWKPTSIFIGMIMESIQPGTTDECEGKKETINVGSLIGQLEREIILMLGICGQYGAIGLVLTAKSLARYKQLEEQSFAEKYLVGTLVSTLIAVLCIIAVNGGNLL